MTNSHTQGRDGVKYDVLEKATALDECQEDQFKPNDPVHRFHYKQVRQGVQLFQNTSFDSWY